MARWYRNALKISADRSEKKRVEVTIRGEKALLSVLKGSTSTPGSERFANWRVCRETTKNQRNPLRGK